MKENPNGGDLKCSPGLFEIRPETPYLTLQIRDGDHCWIADVYGESKEVRKANAALFIAAKELYVNLVTLVDCLETINAEVLPEPINLDHIREAKAALKKARGEK